MQMLCCYERVASFCGRFAWADALLPRVSSGCFAAVVIDLWLHFIVGYLCVHGTTTAAPSHTSPAANTVWDVMTGDDANG